MAPLRSPGVGSSAYLALLGQRLMSCHGGTHHICECQRDLMEDCVDSLSQIIRGLNEYRDTLSMHEKGILTRHIGGVSKAVSILNRFKRI